MNVHSNQILEIFVKCIHQYILVYSENSCQYHEFRPESSPVSNESPGNFTFYRGIPNF